MVNDDDLRKLRALAEKYRIHQRAQTDDVPSAHSLTFKAIFQLGQKTFQAYSDSIDAHNEQWKRRNKSRAEWLARSAGELSARVVNESTWRLTIEKPILERFSTEIACTTCEKRIWNSELEAEHTGVGSNLITKNLDQRRLQREPCNCPIADRPRDTYEMGTTKIFETAVEEFFVHENTLKELPKQKPNCIFGFKNTEYIRQFLEQSNSEIMQSFIRTSPLKHGSPIFPFLALEAKSDSSSASFSDIQTQTALPLWALLNLQNDLNSRIVEAQGLPKPLAWFLGYRGSDWKVYGCYLGSDLESNITYNIHHLASGDCATTDGAIRLILIIDYIVDWARDILRASIVGQLKSLKTGIPYDNVSIGRDSDIHSSKRRVVEHASQSAKTMISDDASHRFPNETIGSEDDDQNDDFSLRFPDTRWGTVRPFATVTFELAGIRVTDENVATLLALGPRVFSEITYSTWARDILNRLTKQDDGLLVLGADLDYIDRVWVGEPTMDVQFGEGQGTEFYAIAEYRCYFSTTWNVIRELSYFAISKSAYATLLQLAAFKNSTDDYRKKERYPGLVRDCSGSLIKDAVDCLRSGSAWQVFHSAISSTLFSLNAGPQRARPDSVSVVEFVGLNYVLGARLDVQEDYSTPQHAHPGAESVPVRSFIEQFLKAANAKRGTCGTVNPERAKELLKPHRIAWEEDPLRKLLRLDSQLSDVAHDLVTCPRCSQSGHDSFKWKYWDPTNIPSASAHSATLVASLSEERRDAWEHQDSYDLSLFIFQRPSWIESEAAFSVIVEDLAQNSSIYYTIRHEAILSDCNPQAELWNLPSPYRRFTYRPKWDIDRWVKELNGHSDTRSLIPEEGLRLWDQEQILLKLYRQGKSFMEAMVALTEYSEQRVAAYYTYQYKYTGRRKREESIQSIVRFRDF